MTTDKKLLMDCLSKAFYEINLQGDSSEMFDVGNILMDMFDLIDNFDLLLVEAYVNYSKTSEWFYTFHKQFINTDVIQDCFRELKNTGLTLDESKEYNVLKQEFLEIKKLLMDKYWLEDREGCLIKVYDELRIGEYKDKYKRLSELKDLDDESKIESISGVLDGVVYKVMSLHSEVIVRWFKRVFETYNMEIKLK